MSVILTEPNNKIVMAAPGRPMLVGPLPTTVPNGSGSLLSIPGLTGWWDAGETDGVLGPSDVPLASFGQAAGGVADR
jgi:hypothetical protein